MTRSEELHELNTRWHRDNTCGLKTLATNPVFGDGDPNADIVFIGEAPGKKEDLEGRPFVGASGKFLSEMLESIQMTREKVYITNCVKYRPPENRDPSPAEKEACRPWLEDELTFINPKIIIFLGRHALNTFFPDKKISDVHGTLLTGTFTGISTTNFIALYHPASALYNGGLRETLIKDFKQISLILKKLIKATA